MFDFRLIGNNDEKVPYRKLYKIFIRLLGKTINFRFPSTSYRKFSVLV